MAHGSCPQASTQSPIAVSGIAGLAYQNRSELGITYGPVIDMKCKEHNPENGTLDRGYS